MYMCTRNICIKLDVKIDEEVKNSIRNGEAKEFICKTHGLRHRSGGEGIGGA